MIIIIRVEDFEVYNIHFYIKKFILYHCISRNDKFTYNDNSDFMRKYIIFKINISINVFEYQ